MLQWRIKYMGGSAVVPVHFRLEAGGHLSLRTGRYDHMQPLVVDPTLSYGTNLGGSSSDFASGITVDSAGNTYLAGSTSSPDFPVVRALQPREPGTTDQEDAFVTKLNPSGTALLFSTYLGGNNDEDGAGIALGRSGAIYVTGFTRSSNFPQQHALKQQSGGCNRRDPGGDAFVVKLGPRGDTPLYSTCLGGSATDWGTWIAVDHTGAATITGATGSDNFPTANPYQRHRAGSADAFVAKLAPGGTHLLFSTYLGGKGADEASGVALDGAGSIYVVGSTDSPTFPGRWLVQPHAAGATDAFVAEFAHRVGAWSMPDVWAAREQTRRSAWRLMHAGRLCHRRNRVAGLSHRTRYTGYVRRHYRRLRHGGGTGRCKYRLQYLSRR